MTSRVNKVCLSIDTKLELCELSRKGYTNQQLADQFGAKIRTVRDIVKGEEKWKVNKSKLKGTSSRKSIRPEHYEKVNDEKFSRIFNFD